MSSEMKHQIEGTAW